MNNKITYIISAAGLAVLLLVIIQAKWMKQSVDLIKEQFDQKVSMAMCGAIEQISKVKGEVFTPLCTDNPGSANSCCSSMVTTFPLDEESLGIIEQSLLNYDIQLPFELSVHESNIELTCPNNNTEGYTCSLNPFTNQDQIQMNIIFPGKKQFILKKLWFMIALSLIILLFIIAVFGYATFYLIKQKKISERNKDFFNHMAHEFKTPLTNIRLATNMLKKKHDDQLLDIIASEGREMTENLNHVLSMASLENGHYQLEKENVNILGLIQEIVDQFHIRLKETNGQLNIHNKSKVDTIYADRFHLSNVIKNIIDNAIKYNDNRPEVNIMLENEGDFLKISIHDNGIGIKKTEQKLIFEKFFRVKDGDTYDEKGFGIGLSYVKKIIELHKGNIVVNSEWEKGSSFSLMLPKI